MGLRKLFRSFAKMIRSARVMAGVELAAMGFSADNGRTLAKAANAVATSCVRRKVVVMVAAARKSHHTGTAWALEGLVIIVKPAKDTVASRAW